jgi:N4-gp56 family major capsid protein
MAVTPAVAGLTPQIWDDKFFTSYVRANQFSRYMGTTENALIQVKEDLTKKNGDKVTFALVNDLTGAGVAGSTALEGAEEALGSRSATVTVALARNGVVVHEWDEQKSAIDLRNAAKPQLKSWLLKKDRTDILTALGTVNGVAFASATEAQRDAWLDDNFDRVLFGKLVSNTDATGGTVAYDYSSSLAAIDNTDDKLTKAVVSLAKRRAKIASPTIRPIEVDEKGEWYVMFAASTSFRDLKADLATTHADAMQRGRDNPLFVDGDLVYDGVIIKEIPEIAVVSNGTIDCAPNYLCGAQALGFAWAQRPTTRTEQRDYGALHGVAIQQIRGLSKLQFGKGSGDTTDLVDHGVFTVWTAGVADA